MNVYLVNINKKSAKNPLENFVNYTLFVHFEQSLSFYMRILYKYIAKSSKIKYNIFITKIKTLRRKKQ